MTYPDQGMPIFLSILSHVMRLKSRITRGDNATVSQYNPSIGLFILKILLKYSRIIIEWIAIWILYCRDIPVLMVGFYYTVTGY